MFRKQIWSKSLQKKQLKPVIISVVPTRSFWERKRFEYSRLNVRNIRRIFSKFAPESNEQRRWMTKAFPTNLTISNFDYFHVHLLCHYSANYYWSDVPFDLCGRIAIRKYTHIRPLCYCFVTRFDVTSSSSLTCV